MGHICFTFPNGVIQAPLPHTMVLPPKKLPASTTSRHASPKPKRLQKTDLGELRSTPTKPPSALNPKTTSGSASMILILLALLSVLYIQYACSADGGNPICARAQEWAAPHLAWSTPYLDKIRGYVERVDELGAPYLARSQGILREVWERNVQPHVRTIWEKVQGEVGKRR